MAFTTQRNAPCSSAAAVRPQSTYGEWREGPQISPSRYLRLHLVTYGRLSTYHTHNMCHVPLLCPSRALHEQRQTQRAQGSRRSFVPDQHRHSPGFARPRLISVGCPLFNASLLLHRGPKIGTASLSAHVTPRSSIRKRCRLGCCEVSKREHAWLAANKLGM